MNDHRPSCPVCHSNETIAALENCDFLFQTTTKSFTMYLCSNCGCGFLYPQPDSNTLQEAYPEAYFWITKNDHSLTARLESLYRESVLKHHVYKTKSLIKALPEKCKVLDIGCGSGTYLHLLEKKFNINAEGLEASRKAAQNATKKYGLTIHHKSVEEAEFPPHSFDLITMFQVLEHLRNPGEILRKISKWLSKNGFLLLQVPNIDSFQFNIFKKCWTGIDIPRHLVNFTPQGIKLLLNESGFRVDKFMFFSLRDSAAAIVSSLFPAIDPVSLNIRGNIQFAFFKKFLYFTLLTLFQPFALFEAMCGKGGIMFVVARVKQTKEEL